MASDDWREQQIAPGVTRCPNDPDNNGHAPHLNPATHELASVANRIIGRLAQLAEIMDR